VADDSFTVGTLGGGIQIKRVRPHDDKKIQAAEFIENSSLAVGDVLGG